jgi:hypothetical protein
MPGTWSNPSLSAAYVLWDQRQRRVLLVGMVFDGFFGVLVMLTPFFSFARSMLDLVGLRPMPRDVWFELCGVFLLIMAVIYAMTARDVNRYRGNVVVAIIGKIVSVPFYLVWVWHLGGPASLAWIAVADAVMCALHIWAIGPHRAARIRAAFRKASVIEQGGLE